MFLPSAVAVVLDRTDRRALPVQVADHLRADIRSGQAAVGLRLPSSRKLAAELSVARGVVERAYEQLIAEGWLVAVHGSGTFVAEAPSPVVTPATTPAKPADKLSPRVQLRPGVPWTPPRASAAWRRAWRDVGAKPPPFEDPDPAGDYELRSALSELLARARGMSVEPERILITSVPPTVSDWRCRRCVPVAQYWRWRTPGTGMRPRLQQRVDGRCWTYRSMRTVSV